MGGGTGTGSVEAPKRKFPGTDDVEAVIPYGRFAYIAALHGYVTAASVQIEPWSGSGCREKAAILNKTIGVIAKADSSGTMEPPLSEPLSGIVQAAAEPRLHDPLRNANYHSRGPEWIKERFDAAEMILAAVIDHGMRDGNGQ